MFCLRLVHMMLMKALMIMLMIITLFLLSKIQSSIFLFELFHQETIKNYQKFSVKDLKDRLIGMNRKQKMRIKLQQINIDIFSNQILLESIDYFF